VLDLARVGMAVAVVGRDVDAGEETARLVGEAGGSAVFVRADVRSEDELAAAVTRTVDEFGRS
jgi:NAD(P)-dependent dehydrogenase (short-subunit alcohol dehydrogenase family)